MSIGYEHLPLDFAPCPDLAAALAAWEAWSGGKPAPAWAEVDLAILPPKLLPFATVMDVEGKGLYRYRFWGTGLVEIYDADVTGEEISEVVGEGFLKVTTAQLREVVTAAKPNLFRAVIEKKTGARLIKFNLRMPVMDDPDRVTKVITVSALDRVALPDYENVGDVWEAAKLGPTVKSEPVDA